MRIACLCLVAATFGAACSVEAPDPVDEPEPEPVLSAEVAWDFAAGCPPEQLIVVGSRLITSCRTSALASYSSDLHTRVFDPATGEMTSDTVAFFASDSMNAAGAFTMAMSEQGGLGVLARLWQDAVVGTSLVPLDADGAPAGPSLELEGRVVLPAMEEGRATLLAAPLVGGTWQLEALEDGERVTIADLGIAETPLARARLEGGFGVLSARPTGECDDFVCWSSLRWARFDDVGAALDEVEIMADFALSTLDGPDRSDIVKLMETHDGFALGATRYGAGDRLLWFQLDAEGRVVATPPVVEAEDRIEDFAFAALPDGELIVATHEAAYSRETFNVRLLGGDEQPAPIVTVPRLEPTYLTRVTAAATEDGVLFFLRREAPVGVNEKERRDSAVLVQRP